MAGAIIIDAEIITYTGISTNTLTGCTRGTNGTTAATHDIGAITTQVLINPIATQSGSTYGNYCRHRLTVRLMEIGLF
jgi:hypothetical protein